MAKPVWRYPGVLEGRIAPQGSSAQGSEAAYYGYYYDSYGYEQLHVFCLGSDKLTLPIARLELGDAISVEQAFDVTSPQKLLRFAWHMRMPSDMPATRTIIADSVGGVSFLLGSLCEDGDSCHGIVVDSPTSPFTAEDKERVLSVEGATDAGNNTYHRISGVPFNQGDVTGGDRVLIDTGDTSFTQRLNDPGPVTVRVHGLTWTARAYTDEGAGWVERVQLKEAPGRTNYRNELAFNLSKFTGALAVKFELKLELADPLPGP